VTPFSRGLLLACLTLSFSACGPPAPEKPTIRVAAASDLQQAMPILASAFLQESGIQVEATFGASGQLSEQIKQGAPFDVFLSANLEFVEKLGSAGTVDPRSIQPYARGVLAMAVNKLSGVKVASLDDLKKVEVHKVAIANPATAPYGKAARQALERAGLWEVLTPKIVPAESVRQALQLVQSGNAEVAIVGRAVDEVAEARVVPLPIDACDPIIQYLGVVARSNQPEEAARFAEFMLSDTGQGILRELGFRKAASAQTASPKARPGGVD
jgi:molybdate transport system substrate-binding protein